MEHLVDYSYHVVLNTITPQITERIHNLNDVSSMSHFYVSEAPAHIIPKLLSLGVTTFSLVFGDHWPWMEITDEVIIPSDFELGLYKIENWNASLSEVLRPIDPIRLHSSEGLALLNSFSNRYKNGVIRRVRVFNNVLFFEIESSGTLVKITIKNCYWSIEFDDAMIISRDYLVDKTAVLTEIEGTTLDIIFADEDEICIRFSNQHEIFMSRYDDTCFSQNWFRFLEADRDRILTYNEDTGFNTGFAKHDLYAKPILF